MQFLSFFEYYFKTNSQINRFIYSTMHEEEKPLKEIKIEKCN